MGMQRALKWMSGAVVVMSVGLTNVAPYSTGASRVSTVAADITTTR